MIKKGDILCGLVKNINNHGIIVWTFNNMKFFIPLSLITDFKKTNIERIFEINQKINFVVESIDEDSTTGIGNFKANHPIYLRSPFSTIISETKNGFRNLNKSMSILIEEYESGRK
ncbi:S1 RNA-binding domain-containing protein [Mycoplasma tauri]|uniref:S1 RNA-binding domain-containing protein n=1 Tax=Mycoplasma tauri TaxID=547987 RepID=A0A953T9P6_9MOLU|nr:S1 RNA-binding domain-containing protein [Mycoplasma tauri]MBZ4195479.1 S1 RNA-binding domain-containing protein [Mycoplasma tauri]MBZ4203887.1 S1 RNA-binding domain-containing protein [Mycoplasma tauri]MBZ4204117.1 S1 RNA-binding domain-containing protein [Mycoplasma tauri]MBZ4212480.1 S1 RNA-binding domain-containing protein [Mycoplasma tauri]MBZ4218092.1 S1 RNA-binding domain-containing protein [Mycoplasma tauri]